MIPLILRLCAVAFTLFPIAASAHVAFGDTHGFMHGFSHPLSGIDHILAMVAVGLFAAHLGGRALWLVPNHVLLFEAWDNVAALDAFFATDRFKKYSATTGNMVAKRDIRTFSSVAMNIKGI